MLSANSQILRRLAGTTPARVLGEEAWRRLAPVRVDHGAAHRLVRQTWRARMKVYRNVGGNADHFLFRSWALRGLLGTVTAHRFPLFASAAVGVYTSIVVLGIEAVHYENKAEAANAAPKAASTADHTLFERGSHATVEGLKRMTRELFVDRSAFVPPCTFLSTALFLMLSFRLNRSITRWWNGAMQWSAMQADVVALTNSAFVYVKRRDIAVEMGLWSYAFARCCEVRARSSCVEPGHALRSLLGTHNTLPGGPISVPLPAGYAPGPGGAAREDIYGVALPWRDGVADEVVDADDAETDAERGAWGEARSESARFRLHRYILRESCSQFDSLPLTSLTIPGAPASGFTVRRLAPLDALIAAPNSPLFATERLSTLLAQAFDDGHIKGVRALVALQTIVERLVQRSHELDVTTSIPEAARCVLRWSIVLSPRLRSLELLQARALTHARAPACSSAAPRHHDSHSYQKHLRSTIMVWLAILPLALAPHVELAAVPLTAVIAFVVLKTEAISVALEIPFGLDRSDLPICIMNDDLQRKIRDSLLRHSLLTSAEVRASALPYDDPHRTPGPRAAECALERLE